MRTTFFFIIILISCDYCFAQLKVENSSPKPEKEDIYDASQDIYIRDHDGYYITPVTNKSYQKFINQRIVCISDEAFDGYMFTVKQQIIKLPNPIIADIQYKKKNMSISVNRIATYLYRPSIPTPEPRSPNAIDDLRGDDILLHCFEKDDKKKRIYKIRLHNALNIWVTNGSSCAGQTYLIKNILTYDEALSLLEENSLLKAKIKDSRENSYYESSISGKTFLTQSVQNDILIKDDFLQQSDFPVFLLEDEEGELILARLNQAKNRFGFAAGETSYTTYILENHIAYLKEKYIGKLYNINYYSKPNVKGKIEDIVIRDNVLSAKYLDINTDDIGYRAMEWNSTNKQWHIREANEIVPKKNEIE